MKPLPFILPFLALMTVHATEYTLDTTGNLLGEGSVLTTAGRGDLVIWTTDDTTQNRYFGPESTTSPTVIEADMQIGDDRGNGGMYIYNGNGNVSMVFSGTVTGSGTISKRRAGASNVWEFTGDVSRFRGDFVLAESIFRSTTTSGFTLVFSGSQARENVSGTGNIIFGRSEMDITNGKWDNKLVYNYSADVSIGNNISRADGTTATAEMAVNGGAHNTFTGSVQLDKLTLDENGSSGTHAVFADAAITQADLGTGSSLTIHNPSAKTVTEMGVTFAEGSAFTLSNAADNATVQLGDVSLPTNASLTVSHDAEGLHSTTQLGNVTLGSGARMHIDGDATVSGSFTSVAQGTTQNLMPDHAEVRVGGTLTLGHTDTLYHTDLKAGTLKLTAGTLTLENMSSLTAGDVIMADAAKLSLTNKNGTGAELGSVTGGYLDVKSKITAGSVDVLKFNSDYNANVTVTGDFTAHDYFNATGTTSATAAQKGTVFNVGGDFTSTGATNGASNLTVNARNITFSSSGAPGLNGVTLNAEGDISIRDTGSGTSNFFTVNGDSSFKAGGDMSLDRVNLLCRTAAQRGTLTLESRGTITLGYVKMDFLNARAGALEGINISANELDINSGNCTLYHASAPDTQVNLQVEKLDVHFSTTLKNLAEDSHVGDVVVDSNRTLTLQGHEADTTVHADSMDVQGNVSLSNIDLRMEDGSTITLGQFSQLTLGNNATLTNTTITGGRITTAGSNRKLCNVILADTSLTTYGTTLEMENVTMNNMTVSRTAIDAFISDANMLQLNGNDGSLTQTAVMSTGGTLSNSSLSLDVDAGLLSGLRKDFSITLMEGTIISTDTWLTIGGNLTDAMGRYDVKLVFVDADGQLVETVPYTTEGYLLVGDETAQRNLILLADYLEIPEPTTSALLFLGLAGLLRRRRKR